MFTMLLADSSNFWSQWGLLIILVVLLGAMFAWNFYRQKKYQKQEEQMINDIKVGTKVKTYSGIYGTVVGVYESTDGRVAILSLDGKTTMEIDFRAIYAVDQKQEVKDEPQQEQTVEEEKPQEVVAEEVHEEKPEEVKEEVVEEVKAEEPAKKSKKTSKKSK